MKNSIFLPLLAFILFATYSLQAQDLTPPTEGAILRLESTKHKAKIGGECTADIWLIRSNSSRKTKFEGLQANAKPGIAATFESTETAPDMYTMTVSVSENVALGSYTLLIKGEGRNAHKIKGSLITLNVTE